jgi:hypothetical protein
MSRTRFASSTKQRPNPPQRPHLTTGGGNPSLSSTPMCSFSRYAMRVESVESRPLITWADVRVALAFAVLIVLAHLDIIVWGH